MRSKIFFLCFAISNGFLSAEQSWTPGIPQMHSQAIYATTESASQLEETLEASPSAFRKRRSVYPRIEMEEGLTHAVMELKSQDPSAELSLPLSPNFTAVTIDDSGFIPPDSDGAVGPAQYIAAVNGVIRSFNKMGFADGILNISTNSFFRFVLQPGGVSGDPRIRYDQFSNRWYIAMIGFRALGEPNQILLAVSNSATITPQTLWSFFSFYPSAIAPPRSHVGDSADFTTLGIDRFALYIGINVFSGMDESYVNSDAFVINKADLINGNLTITVFRDLLDPFTFTGPVTPEGVDNFDTTSLEGYFIGTNGNDFNSLVLRRIANPGGVPAISGNILIPIPPTAFPLNVPHQGNTIGPDGYLDAIDTRLSHSHVRDRRLFTSHNIGVDANGNSGPSSTITATGSRFYEIDLFNPALPTVVQSGTLFGQGNNFLLRRNFWIPSVMTNGLHQLVLGCSTAGGPYFADAAFTQHWGSDCPSLLKPAIIYTQSSTSYNPDFDQGPGRRWGDYSTVSIDPQDNMTLWTIQEFCNAADSWGCRVVKILAPPPPPFLISPSVVPQRGSVNLTIVGSGVNGQSFYNPPANFPNHLQASLSGCKINFIQVLNPTQLLINVSTLGASGAKTMQITNPDGQTVSSLNTLTICP